MESLLAFTPLRRQLNLAHVSTCHLAKVLEYFNAKQILIDNDHSPFTSFSGQSPASNFSLTEQMMLSAKVKQNVQFQA